MVPKFRRVRASNGGLQKMVVNKLRKSRVIQMHLGPNFQEVKKYQSVGHDERFGTTFAHVINLKKPKRCT